jgi:hypothetical protein
VDAIEKFFRERQRNPLAIRHYVRSLLDAGRILEASFYFDFLMAFDPNSIETNKIGYQLSIKKFETRVDRYERALRNAGASKEEIYSLQLAYYLAFNAHRLIADCAYCLADMELKTEFGLNVLIQAIEHVGEYELAARFIRHHYARIKSSSRLDHILKTILTKRLIEFLHPA